MLDVWTKGWRGALQWLDLCQEEQGGMIVAFVYSDIPCMGLDPIM